MGRECARNFVYQNMLLSLKGLEICRHLEELDASHNQLMNLKVTAPSPLCYIPCFTVSFFPSPLNPPTLNAGPASEFARVHDEPQPQPD